MTRPTELEIEAPPHSATPTLLPRDARLFLAALFDARGPDQDALLRERESRQRRIESGESLDFLAATRHIRDAEWRVSEAPPRLSRRVVEITGPAEPRLMVHALNSQADVFMADLEDSLVPTWANLMQGHASLRDASRGALRAVGRSGEELTVASTPARLMARPRGLHLTEAHVRHRGRPVHASLFDLGLLAYHGARAMLDRGETPAFYLPKLESHLEARHFDASLAWIERAIGLPHATLRVTVLVETLPAVFEMDEMLFELRDRALGLNCGRWDYLFSRVKTLASRHEWRMPDRDALVMTEPSLLAYAKLLITTCHHRGAYALGGMAPQIPIKDDPAENAIALERVRDDKLREARLGHDGTWVAHPGLVALARDAFVEVARDATLRCDVLHHPVSAKELLAAPRGPRTDAGLRSDVAVGVEYLAAWLSGRGCVPIARRMEDVATAELCRGLVWSSVRDGVRTDDGRTVDASRVSVIADDIARTLAATRSLDFAPAAIASARDLFVRLATDSSRFEPFTTLPAYAELLALEGVSTTGSTKTKEPSAP